MIHTLEMFLLWCAMINYGLISLWFCAFRFAHDSLYRLHHRWFKLTVEQFDMFMYGGMGAYKSAVLFFNVAPLIALHFL